MARSTAPLVLGILLLVGAGFFLLAAVGLFVGTSSTPADPGLAVFSSTCMALLAIPGLICLVFYRRWILRERRETTLVALLQTGREVPITDVARTMQRSPTEVTAWINEAIANGRVQGYIDPLSGTFMWRRPEWFPSPPFTPAAPLAAAPQAPPSAPEVPRFCRECGSPIERGGEEGVYRCPNCGHLETLRA